MNIHEIFDKATFTLTYVVWDPATKDGVVLDPVMDYDQASSTVSEESVNKILSFLQTEQIKVHYILETHAHADHVSGSQALKARYPKAKVAIGARITEVQSVFKEFFDLAEAFPTDGRQFDQLFKDRDTFSAGSLHFEVRNTPGHTPACTSYVVGDAVFTGDALFVPDSGVGRCDFPSGSAEALFDSVTTRLFSLPDATRTFTGHDYMPGGRELRFTSTIGEQKRANIHLNAETTKEAFVQFRTQRDKTLGAPRLLLPSVQINIDAGHLPRPHRNGRSYLSIPISKK